MLALSLQVIMELRNCIILSWGRLFLALDNVLAVTKISFQFSAVVFFGSKVCMKFLPFFFWFFKIMMESSELGVESFDIGLVALNFSFKMSTFVITWLEITFKLGILVLKFLYYNQSLSVILFKSCDLQLDMFV